MTWEGAPRFLGWAALDKAPTASAASTSPSPASPGTTPGPWQRAGRAPTEEVVIFLNDFKG